MTLQRTIEQAAEVEGPGLFHAAPCHLRFLPAQEDRGIVFVRTDLVPPVEIPADIHYQASRPHRTTSLTRDETSVETVEHVLSAIWGLGIDNLRIELDAPEPPSLDGSALPFVQVLQGAGIVEQETEREIFVIKEPLIVSDGDASLAVLPGPTDTLEVFYDLDYSETPSIARQTFSFRMGKDDYAAEIAPSRTFLLESEATQFREMGLGEHLSAADVLVMGPAGPVDNELRFADEHVRHKIQDLIGDIALLGHRLRGRLLATRSGHEANHNLVRKLAEAIVEKEKAATGPGEPVMDIRKIMRLLPHRYPFLMVDRILSIEENKAIGVKNVSINEPFFQGHYPGVPLMPGVLIVEAMAQLSGILLSSRLEHTGKTAVLLSMDRVKLRRPVRPGDQLVLEAEALHARTRTGHARCRALVNNEIAAEAEIKFMLVDSEPV